MNLSKKVFIFDDICTTMATLEEISSTLKDKGVEKVYGIVLARQKIHYEKKS